MSFDLTAGLFRSGLLTLATVGGPLFAAMLLVGFVVGILQAATQINDPAVGFIPRIAAAGMITWLLGRWMLERLATFLASAIQQMASGPLS